MVELRYKANPRLAFKEIPDLVKTIRDKTGLGRKKFSQLLLTGAGTEQVERWEKKGTIPSETNAIALLGVAETYRVAVQPPNG